MQTKLYITVAIITICAIHLPGCTEDTAPDHKAENVISTVAQERNQDDMRIMWMDLVSEDTERVLSGLQTLVKLDSIQRRSLLYQPPTTHEGIARVGEFEILMASSDFLTRWKEAIQTIAQGGGDDNRAVACVALDDLAIGLAEAGRKFPDEEQLGFTKMIPPAISTSFVIRLFAVNELALCNKDVANAHGLEEKKQLVEKLRQDLRNGQW